MKRLALYMEDREAFTKTLFALWAEGTQVVLPGDLLPATVEALKPHVDGFASDLPLSTSGESEIDLEFEGLVVFTSGSTGAPTAIPKKLRQLFDEVKTLESTFGGRLPDQVSIFSTVSHQHIYGLLFSVLWPVLTKRALTPRRLEYPEELEQALATGPCVLVSSPAHLKRLPEGRAWQTQLRAVFSSGGPLSEEGAKRSREILGHQPLEVFGSSETGGIAWREGLQSSWQPLKGVQFRQSPEGALEIQSPHLADLNWYTTADRIELDGGSFKLLGRADRIAKIEEKRVSLDLIERTVIASGLVSDARAVVLQGARVSVGLAAVLADKNADRKNLIEKLKAALETTVERIALPRRFRFVDTLPQNAQGKVTEAGLLLLFSDRPMRPDPSWTTKTPVNAVLEMKIPPTLRVLEGHFPNTPVVPGIAQVDWAVNWAREAFGFKGNLSRVEVLKFQALMMPGHEVKLALDWNPEKSTVTFKFTSETATYSSGRVVLSA